MVIRDSDRMAVLGTMQNLGNLYIILKHFNLPTPVSFKRSRGQREVFRPSVCHGRRTEGGRPYGQLVQCDA